MSDCAFMPEAEVSLRIAQFFINKMMTSELVKVSIDGAQVKTGETIHFNIREFLIENGFEKMDGDMHRWQGRYCLNNGTGQLDISSRPGEGDVVVILSNRSRLVIESKKGGGRRQGSREYSLMREAIGQLLTNGCFDEKTIIGVAVPYTEKSKELAEKWSKYELIRRCGIIFLLVEKDGNVQFVYST